MGKSKGISLVAFFIALLANGCSGGGDGDAVSTTSTLELHQFDPAMGIPSETTSLEQTANIALLRAIQYQAFESEFDDEFTAPHAEAWASLNLNDFLEGAPFRKTYSCQAYAEYLNSGRPSSGQGTYTLISNLEQDLTGSVEIVYDDCVINGIARSGSRKTTVLESPEGDRYFSGDPSPHFRIDYNNYYWGRQDLTSNLNGHIEYIKNPEVNFTQSFTTISNIKLKEKVGHGFETLSTTTRCTEDHEVYLGTEYSWRCEIESGEISLNGLGQYTVKSISPFYRTLWDWGAKTEIGDPQGNSFIYWGDGEKKNLTWVTSTDEESTHIVSYDSTAFEPEEQIQLPGNSEQAVEVLGTVFEHWDKKLYAYQSDEFILFKRSGATSVDAIDAGNMSKRAIDLIDPTYDIHINEIGDRLTSGHDGAVRGVFLNDPNLTSVEQQIGFGKIVEVSDEQVVGYNPADLSSDHIERISYTWDSQNNRLLDVNELGYGSGAFAHRGNASAQVFIESIYFRSTVPDNYDNSSVRTGQNYDYLKFFKFNLLLTGSGVLIKCPTSCADSAVYWKSLNETILAKYPLADTQVFVAGATDTEYNSGDANLLVFSTLPVSDLPNRYSEDAPGYGNKLWAVDLNDTRRITEIKIPVNGFSTPGVGFNIHHLSKSIDGTKFVGSGSWNLDSDRNNTVFFSIDPSRISFD